jgi:PAT family beta-lactamase induction signal transducer AmpG
MAAYYQTGEGYCYPAWRFSYFVMAASGLVGVAAVLLSPEPPHPAAPPRRMTLGERIADGVVSPFKDFFTRFGKAAVIVLLLIATYRISDVVMGVMANPFYADMGFTKAEVAAVSKVFGVVMTLAGAFLGGIAVMKLGVLRTLFIGAVLSAGTNLLFSALAAIGHSVPFLVVTVSADNLSAGLASAAFVAFLSGLTSSAYSATQYALFSSLMLLLPKFLAGFSGVLAETLGFSGFFILTAAVGVPVALLVWLAARRGLDGSAGQRRAP